MIEKANRVYSMLLGRRRDNLMEETKRFEEEVKQASVYQLPKVYQSFSRYLDYLERGCKRGENMSIWETLGIEPTL